MFPTPQMVSCKNHLAIKKHTCRQKNITCRHAENEEKSSVKINFRKPMPLTKLAETRWCAHTYEFSVFSCCCVGFIDPGQGAGGTDRFLNDITWHVRHPSWPTGINLYVNTHGEINGQEGRYCSL